MTLVDDQVRSRWGAFNAPLEGRISYGYNDTRDPPITTVGIGCAVMSSAEWCRLPWLLQDGSPASPAQVLEEWYRLRSLPGSHVASWYRGPLHLSDDAVDELAAERLDVFASGLVRYYPDLGSWPSAAQAAALSIAWACGPGYPPGWPHFSAAVRAQNWRGAAGHAELHWQPDAQHPNGNPGVRPRGWAQQALLLFAAGDPIEDTLAEIARGLGPGPHPSLDTAREALGALGIG